MARTCHRAQGSEADYVIVALPPSRLLDPSWLYTAITRARQQVIIVGQPETMRDALQRPYADEHRVVGLSRKFLRSPQQILRGLPYTIPQWSMINPRILSGSRLGETILGLDDARQSHRGTKPAT